MNVEGDIDMQRHRIGLDMFDQFPEDMLNYLRNYGFHFNKKAVEFAISKMTKGGKTIDTMTKAQVDQILNKYNIHLENDVLYDSVYIANMAKADFYGSSIKDDNSLALFIKDYIDDEDQVDGFIFCRWYADMMHSGNPIDWGDLL